MNTLNRILIVVLLLVLIPVVSFVLVTPHTVLVAVGQALENFGMTLGQMNVPLRLVGGIFLALLFDAMALIIIFLEVRRARRNFIRVQLASGGMATLSIESIAEQLQYHLDPIAGVIKVKPTIKAKGEKVQAAVDVTVTAGSNVPEMAAHLVEVVQQVLSVDLGLQTSGDPQVRLSVAPQPHTSRPPAPPARQIAPPMVKPLPPNDSPRPWTGPEEAPPNREPLA